MTYLYQRAKTVEQEIVQELADKLRAAISYRLDDLLLKKKLEPVYPVVNAATAIKLRYVHEALNEINDAVYYRTSYVADKESSLVYVYSILNKQALNLQTLSKLYNKMKDQI